MTMACGKGLAVHTVKRWITEFVRENPDVDVDALRDAFADLDLKSYETPTDAIEDVKERAPDFYGWFKRRDIKDETAELERGQEEYEHGKVEELMEMHHEVDEKDRSFDTVVELCRKNPDYYSFLWQILDIEDKVRVDGDGFWKDGDGFGKKPYGWQLDDIEEMTGGHLSHLCQRGVVYKQEKVSSNKYKYYLLTNAETTRKALTRIAEMKENEQSFELLSKARGFLSNMEVTDEDIERFKEILKENDGLEYWFDAVAPKIVGMKLHKKGILMALASTEDKYEDKNRVHVLLVGEPETGKSKLAWTVVSLGGGWTSGTRASKVGLTFDASQGELTLGALCVNHKGCVGVNELDKFSGEDMAGLLDSMEEGVIPVAVGKFIGHMLPAETIVVASANDIFRVKPEVVSRFDFVVKTQLPTRTLAKDMWADMVDNWDLPKAKQTEELGKFLKWVRDFDPQIPQSVRDKAKELGHTYIEYAGEVRPRRLQSIIRVAKALARLNRRDVEIGDMERSLKLINQANEMRDELLKKEK